MYVQVELEYPCKQARSFNNLFCNNLERDIALLLVVEYIYVVCSTVEINVCFVLRGPTITRR